MTKVHRPPSKAGNFLKAAQIKGDSATVKVTKVRPDQDLPAGAATVLDVIYDGKPYGFVLNVTNHKRMCKLFGDDPDKTPDPTFDAEAPVGKNITLIKVLANNPRSQTEGETLRIKV